MLKKWPIMLSKVVIPPACIQMALQFVRMASGFLEGLAKGIIKRLCRYNPKVINV